MTLQGSSLRSTDRSRDDRRDAVLAAAAAAGARFLESTDPRDAMQPAVEALRAALDCDQVSFRPLGRDDGTWARRPRIACANREGVPPLLLDRHLTPAEVAAVDARLAEILVDDRLAARDDILPRPVRERVTRLTGYRDTVVAPVRAGTSLSGTLAISTRDPGRRFSEGELDALALAARLFSAALRRAAASDELARRDAILRAVARVATDARTLRDPEETATRLVGELATATLRPVVSVCRTVPGTRLMSVVALHGDLDPERATLDDRTLFADAVEAYRNGRHVVLGSEDLTAGQRAVLRKTGTTAENLLGMPIVVDGSLWGHIVIGDDPGTRPYSDAEIEAIRIAAGLVSAAATRLQAERALRESEAMLLQAQKLEAIGLLAGGVAHDFSNTLMAVRGFASLIEEDTHEDLTRSYAQQITDAAERSSGLLRRLLDLARKDRHDPVASDVGAMLDSLRLLLGGIVPRNIALSIETAPGTPAVEIDPGEFEQVTLNLVLNACDALPQGGSIAIRAAAGAGGDLRLTVRDTGTGIDPETLECIFDPFFTTKDRARGSGIGLTVVQGILTRAGGSIEARSVPGEGSTFTVALPAARATSAGRLHALPAAPHPTAPASRGRILLVEDDDRLRPALETLLRRRGYDVVSTSSAEGALDVLDREGPRLRALVTDVVMAGMDGRSLASGVQEAHPGLAVVLMSGYPAEPGRTVDGAVFVPKHQTCAALIDAVETALGAHAA